MDSQLSTLFGTRQLHEAFQTIFSPGGCLGAGRVRKFYSVRKISNCTNHGRASFKHSMSRSGGGIGDTLIKNGNYRDLAGSSTGPGMIKETSG